MSKQFTFEDFRKFEGGTLVEYTTHQKFDREWNRGIILRIQFYRGGLNTAHILTDTIAEFATTHLDRHDFYERHGVLYIQPKEEPLAIPTCYAVAPLGVMIPKPGQEIVIVEQPQIAVATSLLAS